MLVQYKVSHRCPKLWPRVAMRIKLHIYADDVTRLACLADFQAVQCLVTIVLILSRNFAILATQIPYDSKKRRLFGTILSCIISVELGLCGLI